MYFKKFKTTPRNIKLLGAIFEGAVIGLFIVAIFTFNEAAKMRDSDYYFWSSSVRSMVSKMNALGTFFLIIGVFSLFMRILFWKLEKNGRVCPKCEQIYPSTVAICPNCNIDISNAMGVKEYLKNKPTVAPKAAVAENTPVSAPKADTAEAPSAVSENAHNRAARRFCPFCGKPTEGGAAFCSNCGKPLT